MKHSLHNGNGPTQDEPSLSNGLSPSPVSASSGHDPTEQRPMPSLSEEETEQRSDSEWQESSPSDTNKQQPIETVSSPTAPLGGSLRETAGSPGTVVNGTAPANVRDSSWLELEVCREYSRGACSRADCRFIHPDGNVLVKDGKVTCCFDYLKDRCTRERCKYLHPPAKIKDKLIQAGKQYGHAMALATQPPKTALTAIPPLPVGSALGMPLPMGAMGYPAASSNYAVSMPNSPVSGELVNRLNICRDFERGRCMRGDRCFFAHPEPYVRRNPDNTVTVCWNFMQQGYCRHEQCWYFHPPPHIVTLYSIFPPPVSSPLLPQPMMVPPALIGVPPFGPLSSPVSPPVSIPAPLPLHHGSVGIGPLMSPVMPVSAVPPLIHPGHPSAINLLPMSEV